MIDAFEVIKALGFPVFVALWHMLRLERRIERLTSRVAQLVTINAVLVRSLDIPEDERRRMLRAGEEDSS